MTRIIAGSAGGRTIVVPRGGATRPTSDLVREALFSRLEHAVDGGLEGARVLDLYAGSGALGLEAASRGAAHVLLVDRLAAAATACRRNARSLGLAGVEVRAGAVSTALAEPPGAPYDVVLLDPPYDLPEATLGGVLRLLVEGGWLAEHAVVVVERSRRSPVPSWPDGLASTASKRYGDTVLHFAEAEHLAWLEPEWAERVRALVEAHLTARPGEEAHSSLANGATHLRSWAGTEEGRPVLHVVYRHPWWSFPTGLRLYLDSPPVTGDAQSPPELHARDIVDFAIGEPLGASARSMVPDDDGVWWWGDDPLPGDHARRGPAPVG